MATPKLNSTFTQIASRELNSFRVRKRPPMDGFFIGFQEQGALEVQHSAENTIPLSLSFCKTSKYSHILALSDEDGYVNLLNTRCKFSQTSSFEDNAEKAKICDWLSHNNAVFDVCWIKDDTQILTASGDQTMKVWDVQEQKFIGVLTGHTGSVKSMSSHPTNDDIIVSGSRDGSFCLWDLRCKSTKGRLGEVTICSTTAVKGAHISTQLKRARKSKANSMSITSVLYLKDEVSIATAGAVDSVLKFWDTRNLRSVVTQACPRTPSTEKERLHGISSLSQDESGLYLTASCMDNCVYLYNTLQLDKGPFRSFRGCRIESFFVKCAISPDASQIVCGSSDGRAHVWQVNKPQELPVVLKSHDGEVTAVDWCPADIGKLATASDDFTVRIWNKTNCICDKKMARTMRRRIMAMPSTDCRFLSSNEEMCPNSADKPIEAPHLPINSITPVTPTKMLASEGHKNQISLGFDPTGSSEKTPESASKSPSSVLNPPSSLKRTIRDYFSASS